VEHNILAEFLLANASEVFNMLTAEFKMEEAVQVWKEEGIEEGIEKGEFEAARKMLAYGMALPDVAKILELPIDKLQTLGSDK
jgi:predicted transposase/invertase (TIGR01784 family)